MTNRLKPEEFIDKYKESLALTSGQCEGLRYYLSISDTNMLIGRGIGLNRRIARIIRTRQYEKLNKIKLEDRDTYIKKLLTIAAKAILNSIKIKIKEDTPEDLISDLAGVTSRYLSYYFK